MSGTPSQIGARAEAAVASALVRADMAVFLPAFGGRGRIDLIYDDGHRLVRAQCKSSRIVGEVLSFRTCSNTANSEREYRGQADVFGVYSPELERVYIVPVESAPIRRCFLRLGPAGNGQQKGLRWASDYLLGLP